MNEQKTHTYIDNVFHLSNEIFHLTAFQQNNICCCCRILFFFSGCHMIESKETR